MNGPNSKIHINLFDGMGSEWSCVPYYNMWVHYNSITEKKKLPMYLGISTKVDAFIAEQLGPTQ